MELAAVAAAVAVAVAQSLFSFQICRPKDPRRRRSTVGSQRLKGIEQKTKLVEIRTLLKSFYFFIVKIIIKRKMAPAAIPTIGQIFVFPVGAAAYVVVAGVDVFFFPAKIDVARPINPPAVTSLKNPIFSPLTAA